MKALLTIIFLAFCSGLVAQQMTNKGVFTSGENASIKVPQITNDGNLVSQGNWLVSGDISNNGNMDLVGNTTLKADSTLSINGDSSITFSNLNVDAPAGLELNNNIKVRSTLSLINGKVNINGYYIDLDSTGILVGETESNRIYGNSGQITLGNQTFNLDSSYSDVGGLGIDVRFNSTGANPGSVDFTRFYSTYGLAERMVAIAPQINSDLAADIILHYFDDELSGPESNLTLNESTQGDLTWDEINSVPDTINNTFTSNDRTSLFFYGFSDGFAPLPVELMVFNGHSEGNVNKLNWKTASELDNDQFIIQRSSDGKRFENIGRVNGNGTTRTTQQYFFTDNSPLPDINYYRLGQLDYSGRTTYSKIITIEFSQKLTGRLAIYPNPASTSAPVCHLQLPDDQTLINIYNSNGQLLRTLESYEGSSLRVDLRELNVKAGELLLISVTSATTNYSTKLLIQ